MMTDGGTAHGRRAVIKNGLTLIGAALIPDLIPATQAIAAAPLAPRNTPQVTPRRVPATPTSPRVVRPELMRRALAAMQRHAGQIAYRDRFAIADFTAPSGQPRFHFVDAASGRTSSLLVSHGSGSDPRHTGFLARFSNEFGSNASSEGTFATADYYVGKHGRSQRLIGLDPTNCNALGRAIVLHSAWYANRDVLKSRGVLGRSQGCFAVGEGDLDQVFARLGHGRMIYSAKV